MNMNTNNLLSDSCFKCMSLLYNAGCKAKLNTRSASTQTKESLSAIAPVVPLDEQFVKCQVRTVFILQCMGTT